MIDRPIQSPEAIPSSRLVGPILRRPVIVIGASGRFVAQSALRAELPVSVFDLFSDHDTKQISEDSQRWLTSIQSSPSQHPSPTPAVEARTIVLPITSLRILADQLSHGLHKKQQANSDPQAQPAGSLIVRDSLEVIGSMETALRPAIVFAGGAENHPSLFDAANYSKAIVAGPCVDSVSRLLELSELESCCLQNDVLMPAIISSNAALPRSHDRQWIQKNVRSGGGLQIKPWDRSTTVNFAAGDYIQQKIKGPTVSGCFVAARDSGTTQAFTLGCATQFNNPLQYDFRYQGSYGVTMVTRARQIEMARVANAIATHFDLVGVFGIDFIFTPKGIFLVDINPRIPASAEIIERAWRTRVPEFTIVQTHLDACLKAKLPAENIPAANLPAANLLASNASKPSDGANNGFGEADMMFSKRIVYWASRHPLKISDPLLQRFLRHGNLTDLPKVGSVVSPGQPLLTLHASAVGEKPLLQKESEENNRLQSILKQWHL